MHLILPLPCAAASWPFAARAQQPDGTRGSVVSTGWHQPCPTRQGEKELLYEQSYALANKGHDTRALQAYLGHRKIQHTVRYTELSPTRFKAFWRE